MGKKRERGASYTGVNLPISRGRLLVGQGAGTDTSFSLAAARSIAGIMALKCDISSKVSRNICEQH